ncbi:NAD-dependent succinate-semialdehyde dehydrogenase [Rhodoluna sp. KAS3]|uniref:NAD-dependent succinate-semialdehyde dehydrogenase n=1 Tax=Rhodoluna sp. KAS3 TaxID=942880 RepID=UPI002230A684|nr:NAD-dependent succinate-semialdehyde dehydrogenase [Rhodoluna sp. KAS3]BDS49456.1 NAD-dependent succinate-semialdehyde dehydrogenase [Rhodoluna sp. KAS3]
MTLSEAELLAKVPTGLYIDGQWVEGRGDNAIEVEDPATGKVLLEIANANAQDGLAALAAADAAQAKWAKTAPRERAEILRRTFDLVRERAEEFAMLISLEMGKPIAEARGEVTYGNEFLRWFSEEAVRITGRYGSSPEGTGRMLVAKRPVGPAFAITPWNFPLAMATRKIGPALAAGCTIVVKPAELTPLTTLLLVKTFEEAGVPAGVINVITTSTSAATSAPIISDRRLRKITFTGSTAVGRKLLEQSAERVLRTSMELGGNAPFLVFADADLDSAVNGAMLAKMRNIGQACTAANRFIVHESVAEEFAHRFAARMGQLQLGRGLDADTTCGPVIDQRARANMERLVEATVREGGQVITGGQSVAGDGYFFTPTVIDNVQPGSTILKEEIFGPVAPIVRFKTEDEAVALANDTEYGLISYAFTQDLKRGLRLVESLDTGMTGLNTGLVSNAAAPFGGVKESGTGREGGLEGIQEYLETKYVMTPDPFL